MVFNLKKPNEEKIIDRTFKNLSKDNAKYYIEHKDGTNIFMITQDKKQREKDHLFETILNIDKKLSLASDVKNDRNLKELIRLRKRTVNVLKNSVMNMLKPIEKAKKFIRN